MSLPGGMQVTPYTIPANTSPFEPIRATITSRRVEIIEDWGANSGIGQGLEYYFVDPATVPNSNAPVTAPPGASPAGSVFFSIAPQTEPIILGDLNSVKSGYGPIVGNGPQDSPGAGGSPTLGTILIYIRSASANTTNIRVTELV